MKAEMDISDIMPTPEQEAAHYIDLQKRQKPVVVQSKLYPKIFYSKRNMRQLLEQRTSLCLTLGLTSKNGKKDQIDKQSLEVYFGQLFKDGPDTLTQFSWTILEDRGTVYGFLASQDKFVPLCKCCNRTVYISLRGTQGRIACSQPTCKVKLLGEFETGSKNRTGKSRSIIHQRQNSFHGIRKSEVLQSKNQEIQLSLHDKELIKKAAKRVVH